MRPVLLLGWNYLREQRVFMIVLAIYLAAGSGWLALTPETPQLDDLAFIVKQQAEYAIVFGLFMTSGAIFTDRRTRRILLVLAKGIERSHYLCGIYLGSCGALLGYLFLSWLACAVLLDRVGISWGALAAVMCAAAVATLLSSAIALFYSTMMHPMLAVGAAVVTMSMPHALARIVHPGFDAVVPVYAISSAMLAWNPGQGLQLPIHFLLIGMVEVAAFLFFATLAFRKRDLALTVD